jgi:hypothetical protein
VAAEITVDAHQVAEIVARYLGTGVVQQLR